VLPPPAAHAGGGPGWAPHVGGHGPWPRYQVADFGTLVYDDGMTSNRNASIAAHCPVHGRTCRLNRTLKAGKPGTARGRPIGSLIAWLWAASEHDSQASHMRLVNGNPKPAEAVVQMGHAKRVECRQWAEAEPSMASALELERPQWDSELGTEPPTIP
jgi:hypothetical protein